MAFRRINVDQYDEDHDIPTADLTPSNSLSDQELGSLVQTTSQQIRSFLQKGDSQSALRTVLSVVPYGPSPALEQVKMMHTNSVVDVLNAIKSTDISTHLNSLDWDARDVLMKYLYKGMEQPSVFNTGVLLNWHEKLVEIAGHGSIVRYLSDRRTV